MLGGGSSSANNASSANIHVINSASASGKTWAAHESFKLIEKVQPKKSRTKYSKDQVITIIANGSFFFFLLDKSGLRRRR